jgi:hypothetical protein
LVKLSVDPKRFLDGLVEFSLYGALVAKLYPVNRRPPEEK